ncbi:ATP-binding protein [Mycobacterium sp.]|uniref:ATP-binding protein n=1 Tax=Mycobacterium sp. TaxID=1785 RepID=UPI002D6CA633|nr:ATP-binding protein [Mycobacterium sp.]HZA08710.1 ATP-binding protein [Mycobacterium sp.]
MDVEPGYLPCNADELRRLFLFDALTEEQLAILCAEGRVKSFEPGPLCLEGEPATCFYVLLDGELVMSKRSGGQDIETNRTSQKGVYCGAWSAFMPDQPNQTYAASVRVTKPSRFFIMDAAKFGDFMRVQFPMAVHLLVGHTLGRERQHRIIGPHERLIQLGQLTAGLTHELNNPAAAAARATSELREKVAGTRHKLAMLADGKFTPETLRTLVAIQEEVAELVGKAEELSPLEKSDREDAVGEWLENHGISGAWDLAPTFVEAGLDSDWLERVSATVDDADATASLEGAIRWLNYTIATEQLMNEIADSTKRISTLITQAKQYSQLGRAPFDVTDIHLLLKSTLTMLSHKIGSDIKVVKDFDRELPHIPCYPAELNQVWTNLIDNAVGAMRESGTPDAQGFVGTLTVRTCRQGEMVRVEICDTGPGIPDENRERIFDPFFTTKPVGEGTGLGLDFAARIIDKHNGNLWLDSKPGDTRFIALLPLEVAEPVDSSPEVSLSAE